MEQRVARLKSCLAHIQRQFSHMTAVDMPDDVRDYLGAMWQHVMHMQLEVAALERQQTADAKAHIQTAISEAARGESSEDDITLLDATAGELTADELAESRGSYGRHSAVTAHSGEQNRAILVIDDCQNTQNILSFSLGGEGLDITSLTEPERWLAVVRQVRPQVVLLDLMMPGMDGFEVLRQLRATKDFDSIFVVVGSSRSFEHDRLAVLGMGADDFIPKPYHIKELALKFHNLIRSVRRYS